MGRPSVLWPLALARRWGETPSLAILTAWLAGAAALTAGPFLWHVEYFRSPGEGFYRLILALLPTLAGGAAGYAWLRGRGLWRWEPVALAGLVVAAGLLYRPAGFLTVLALASAWSALGGRLLRWTGAAPAGTTDRLVLAFGVGAGAWMLALFPLGVAGLWSVWTVGALLAVSLWLGRSDLRGAVAAARGLVIRWGESEELRSTWVGVPVFFAFLFAAVSLAVALAPPLAFDALMLHLPSVRAFAAQGSLAPLPHLSYSLYPQGFESLLTAAYLVGGRGAAQLVQPAFFLATLLALAALSREVGLNRAARVSAVVFVASLPFLAWSGSIVKNDLGMAFFQVAALVAWFRAEGVERRTWLRWALFLLAASLAVKYTAAFGVAAAGMLCLWKLRPEPHKLRELILWGATGVAVVGGWPLRAYLETGNPLYPAPVHFVSVDSESTDDEGRGPIPVWLVPWVVHFEGRTSFQSPSENPAGFFLLLFLPAWLLVRRRGGRGGELALLVFGGVYFFLWQAGWPVLRYFIAPLAALILLTANRAAALYADSSRLLRGLLVGAALYNLLFCLLPALIVSVNGPQLLWLAKRIDEPEYLRRTLITYPALEFLNAEAKPGERVLSVALYSAAYAPDPALFHCETLGAPAESLRLAPQYLAERRYDWLILPVEPWADPILDGIAAELAYRDDVFRIYRLE